MDKYPIYIDGDEKGELKVYKDGLMTVFDAKIEGISGLIKLYVFGADGSAYLGTMQPQSEGQRLVRRLSRSGMKSFPEEIEYAADREMKPHASERENDILWRRGTKGCLVSITGGKKLIAIPTDGTRLRVGRELLRVIEGREYMIFPGKA